VADLLVRNATLPDGRTGCDVLVTEGRIVDVAPRISAAAADVLDAHGYLLSPPFVDAHFHMDSTLSYGLPRVNLSGTLLEGIALWGELKPLLTQEAVVERALAYCDWAVAKGLLAIRSHVDVCDPRLLAVEALLHVREKVKPYLDLQLVAFPQDGVLRSAGALDNLKRALAMGVDVIGGIPHFERTMADGAESIRILCELAVQRGCPVDMHCDETDDPLSRHIETLAFHTQRLGMQGRVTGSHSRSRQLWHRARLPRGLRAAAGTRSGRSHPPARPAAQGIPRRTCDRGNSGRHRCAPSRWASEDCGLERAESPCVGDERSDR